MRKSHLKPLTIILIRKWFAEAPGNLKEKREMKNLGDITSRSDSQSLLCPHFIYAKKAKLPCRKYGIGALHSLPRSICFEYSNNLALKNRRLYDFKT
jgi:hypothetical protein